MPYFVKWRLAANDRLVEHYVSYGRLFDALDFGCAMLDQNPTEIWVEDEHGNRFAEKQRIIDHYRQRGMLPL